MLLFISKTTHLTEVHWNRFVSWPTFKNDNFFFLEPLLQSSEIADEPPTLIKEDLLPLTAQVQN